MLPNDYVVVEFDTTSYDKDAEVISAVAIKVKDGQISDKFVGRSKPTKAISPEIYELTGFKKADFEGEQTEEELMKGLIDFIGTTKALVGHNLLKYHVPHIEKFGYSLTNFELIDTISLLSFYDFFNIGSLALGRLSAELPVINKPESDVKTEVDVYRVLDLYQKIQTVWAEQGEAFGEIISDEVGLLKETAHSAQYNISMFMGTKVRKIVRRNDNEDLRTINVSYESLNRKNKLIVYSDDDNELVIVP